MRHYILTLICSLFVANLIAKSEEKIHTEDIYNFWIAYDSVLTTNQKEKQVKFVQTLYIDKASQGLKDFINARNFTADEWVKDITQVPKFWKSIRPKTLDIMNHKQEINAVMARFKQIYPAFKQPDIYFTMGCLRTGGTTTRGKILIAAEMTGDSTTDSSELPEWYKKRFKNNSGIAQLVAHEAVHTQQKEDCKDIFLLGKCLGEGSCDFIAELLLNGQPYNFPYLTYGKSHEKELYNKFKEDMNKTDESDWLYNGTNAKNGQEDLGYFMGYAICKYYYETAKNKAQAIAGIVDIDYSSNELAQKFYDKTKYADKMK